MYPGLEALPLDVLVDTTVLRDVVFAEVFPAEQRDHLRDATAVAMVRSYLQTRRRRATTPQVLTELDYHLRRASRGRKHTERARYRAFGGPCRAFGHVDSAGLLALDLEVVKAFGPTDAALLEAARRESLTLFTGDVPLEGVARNRGLSVLSVWQVLTHPATHE